MKFHFDLLAPLYEFILGNDAPPKLLRIMEFGPDMRLLEVGGGTGRIVQNLETYVDTAWLVDPSVPMLQEARGRYPDLKLVRSYAESMPFPSDYFDRVLIYDSLHHWDHHRQAIEEIYRVIKPAGSIIIGEIHPKHRAGYFIEKMEQFFRMRSVFFTPRQLQSMMEDSGFSRFSKGWINPPTYYVRAYK